MNEEKMKPEDFSSRVPQDKQQRETEFETAQRAEKNITGIPEGVKQIRKDSVCTDFSDVRIRPDTSTEPGIGPLAYTQGTDVHFAPGLKPDTSAESLFFMYDNENVKK